MIDVELEVASTQVLMEFPYAKDYWLCLLLHLAVILLCRGERLGGESSWFLSAIWSTLRNDSTDVVRRCVGCQSIGIVGS